MLRSFPLRTTSAFAKQRKQLKGKVKHHPRYIFWYVLGTSRKPVLYWAPAATAAAHIITSAAA
jgi:hypothetical protein